jgi:hypothetical protein
VVVESIETAKDCLSHLIADGISLGPIVLAEVFAKLRPYLIMFGATVILLMIVHRLTYWNWRLVNLEAMNESIERNPRQTEPNDFPHNPLELVFEKLAIRF